MKTLVVYDSYFGNTKLVAETIANVLDAKAAYVNDVKLQEEHDLIIVGGPTRAFHATKPIMQFLKSLDQTKTSKVAVFDTRADETKLEQKFLKWMMKKFGYASEKMAKVIQKRHDIELIGEAQFYVKDSEGPLEDNMLQKAEEWAKSL